MVDPTNLDDSAPAEEQALIPEDKFDRLFGVVADGVVGAAGGLVGTALMTMVLLVANSMGAFNWSSFALLTRPAGLDAIAPPETIGFVLFLLGGMIPWPLLFASLKAYLPGDRDPIRGIAFGTALWTGFAMAFYDGYAGTALALYVVLTLVAHWAYGFGVGLVFEYLSSRPDTLV
jgi:hypothetical protein